MISCLSMKLWTHFAPPLFNGLPCVSQCNYHKFQLFSFNFQSDLDQNVINLSVVVVVMVALFRFATVFWLVTRYDLVDVTLNWMKLLFLDVLADMNFPCFL